MPGQKLRWLTAGLFASAGAGMLSLSSIINPAFAFADDPTPDIGLVMGGTGLPIPGSGYVEAADYLYLNHLYPYPDLTFYQATSSDPTMPGFYGNGLFTPEQAYPLFGGGVHQEYYNYPLDSNGLPDISSSVGQGATILESTINGNTAAGDLSTVFGYSQSSTLSGITMQMLDPSGTPDTTTPAQFLLIADPSNPNGGLFERFNGFETTSGQTTVDPLNLPSMGISFDGATPANDFPTTIYSLEYDGFADFPRYPLNFLADLNAFLGIADLHGTYLNYVVDGTGPTPTDIADAVLLPGSMNNTVDPCADCLTNYYMIDTLDGSPVTPPLVSTLGDLPVIGKPLEDLLGPDLTVLINLGYGGDNLGYSDAPANVATPFGLFPDVNPTTLMNELATGAQQGLTAFENDLSNFSLSSLLSSLTESSTTSTTSLSDIFTALENDFSSPEAASTTLTDLVNAFSSVASTAYSTLLPTTDIINALVTSLPAYDVSLITDNLQSGDFVDALGLPVAANTAIDTLAVGFEFEVLSDAASAISATLSGLF